MNFFKKTKITSTHSRNKIPTNITHIGLQIFIPIDLLDLTCSLNLRLGIIVYECVPRQFKFYLLLGHPVT